MAEKKTSRKRNSNWKRETDSMSRRQSPSTRIAQPVAEPASFDAGSGAAGQSGSTQGVRQQAPADPESVEELLEEGQAFEAEAVVGVERATDNEGSEVNTGEIPEDDVPIEYRNLRERQD